VAPAALQAIVRKKLPYHKIAKSQNRKITNPMSLHVEPVQEERLNVEYLTVARLSYLFVAVSA
jgi:hypothetical protein